MFLVLIQFSIDMTENLKKDENSKAKGKEKQFRIIDVIGAFRNLV